MQNRAILNESNNLYDRNNIEGKQIQQNLFVKLKKEMNNYLDPLKQYQNEGSYAINENQCHRHNCEILKSKEFSKRRNNANLNFMIDQDERSVIVGRQIPKSEYMKLKSQPRSNSTLDVPKSRMIDLQRQNPIFYKDCFGQQIRYPSGFYNKNKKIIMNGSISNDAPDWFKYTSNEKTINKYNNYLRNQENILVFSKYQKWITVNPKQMNRKRPLEKMKNSRLDRNSITVPDWMKTNATRNQTDNQRTNFNKLKKIELQPIRNVFSIYDFRHNVMTDKETKEEMKKVSQLPHRLIE